MTIMSAIPAYEAERNRQAANHIGDANELVAAPTKAERLIARANAAITSLRHGAGTGHCDAAKARRLAGVIERQLFSQGDQYLIHGTYPQGSDVADTLAEYGPWIAYFRRQTQDREIVA